MASAMKMEEIPFMVDMNVLNSSVETHNEIKRGTATFGNGERKNGAKTEGRVCFRFLVRG
jgi:hypothetical protein